MNFTSRSLTQKMDIWVVYPTPTLQDMIQHKDAYDATRQWPVVYMLHGAGGDGFEWVQRADVEAWCCKYGFIAVMPSCQLSFYNDTPDGRNFATYVAWELPNMIEATFHASRQAKDRYLMGYSMGGFGAVRIGLCNPDRYHKLASLSGCMDVAGFINAFEGGSIFRIHGALAGWPDIQGSDNDTLALLDRAAARKARGEYVPPCTIPWASRISSMHTAKNGVKKPRPWGWISSITKGMGSMISPIGTPASSRRYSPSSLKADRRCWAAGERTAL